MNFVDRFYRLVLSGMFGLAGVLMVVMMISIVVDVVLRGIGGQSYAHIFTFNEYFLFVIAFLGAPLLVREKGHVYVEALLMQFPAHWRRRIARLTLVLCIATCAVLAWHAAGLTLSDYERNEVDVRTLDMPRWMLMVFMPISLAMMAVEFGRFLVRGESQYQDDANRSVTY